jgi:hypothetical protein
MKTVAYFLNDGAATSTIAAAVPAVPAVPAGADADDVGGLVRRVLDRATASWAAENGNFELLERGTEVIAPEVVGLEFAYFDGVEWVDQWDSTERGGLPLAVAIAMAVSSKRADRRDETPTSVDIVAAGARDDDNVCIYRLVVDLPMADLASLEAAAEGGEEDSEDEDGETSGDDGSDDSSDAGGGDPGGSGTPSGGAGGGPR